MNALTPLAVANADVLRALKGPTIPSSVSAMAREIERDESNLRKSIKTLQVAGLLCTGLALPSLTDAGEEALAAIERAGGKVSQADPVEFVRLRHDQIIPDPDNARTEFAQVDLESLAETLFSHGLQQPPVVMPVDLVGKHQLVAGERRWRAWGILIASGRWPADHTQLCRLETADELARLEAGLIENLQRVDLNHMEAGLGFERLAQRLGRSNKQIAAAVGKTPEYVQQHRRLSHLTEEQRARVRSGELKFKDALNILAQPKPKPMPADQRLLLAEAAHLFRAAGKSMRAGQRVEVADNAGGAAMQALERAYALSIDHRDHNDGRTYLRAHYYVASVIEKELAELSTGDLDTTLDALRVEALGEIEAAALCGTGRYATDWLNGPFVLPAEVVALLEQRKASKERDDAKRAKDKAKADAARKAVQSIERDLRKVAKRPLSDALAKALSGTGVKLPLKWKAGKLVDAGGKTIGETSYYNNVTDKDSALRLIYVAASAALGFAKDEDAEAEVEDPQRDLDEAAVDRFADALKEKLAAARAKGRSGWHDTKACSLEDLAAGLVEHVGKGDPLDIGAYAMFLSHRGGFEFTSRNLACVFDRKFAGVFRDIAELPDRTSPEGWPDHCLVSSEELYEILSRHFASDLMADQAAFLELRREPTEDEEA